MKAYFAKVPPAVWALAGLPALVVTRCVVAAVVTQVIHAVVPDLMRTLFHVI